uniref:Unannotated protein n=1 Tax=freshwater metagenome TaxID=449393 RepID=A0A6J6A0P8_9ZZZZ
MRHERRDLDSSALGGKGGGQREDVVYDDVRRKLVYEGLRLVGGQQNRLIGLQWPFTGGEDGVLGCRREANPLSAHERLPGLRGLQCHFVATFAQRAAKRDHREGVARVAKGAEQQLHPVQSAASSAISRSWVIRSSRVNATGLTPSVPTPASR